MKAKKVIIALLLTLATIFNCAGALAAEVVPPVAPLAVKDDGVSPQTEETVWCKRFYEGHWQKRLWSITYGRWLTEWENID